MEFQKTEEKLFKKLGTHKIMALASSFDDKVTVRNVSCIFYDNRIFFKTDKNFRKTKQLLKNPNIALCVGGIQIEGLAKNLGLVVDDKENKFEKLYEKYWRTSYNAYPHEETEILIEVIPKFVEIWDQDKNYKGFQTFIDYNDKKIEIKKYD